MIKKILITSLGALLACVGSATYAKNQSLTPNEAISHCLSQPDEKLFALPGHLATTYVIAYIAGQGISNTLILAYFSQYPDENKQLDAIVNAIKNKTPLTKDKYTQDAVTKLHSLHGGNLNAIKLRRDSIYNAISSNLKQSNNFWKAGVLIHAYGDAFAHTKNFGSESEVAYGPTIGHLIHSIIGEDPDQITYKENKQKYLAYVDKLYALLETKNANPKELQDFKESVIQNKCTNDKCFMDEVLTDFHSIRMNRFTYCMNNNMKPLSKKQVQEIMDQIKD